jgi:hypothetical protein
MVAMLLVVILGMAALAIDTGSFDQAETRAQAAADAGALAGADQLSAGTASATTAATTYALDNDPGATISVTTPYDSSSSHVKVSVSTSTPAIFGKMLGVASVRVSASAVATEVTGSPGDAIFADQGCGGQAVTIQGSGVTYNGALQTNGSLMLNDGPNAFGATTYGKGCSVTWNGGSESSTFTSGPTQAGGALSSPVTYTTGQFTCTFTPNANITISGTVSGTYCDDGYVITFGSPLNGTATFIASQFNANAFTGTLTPAQNGVLLYQTSTNALQLDSTNYLDGTIYAPTAFVEYHCNTSGGTVSGFIDASSVTIDGCNGLNWTGTGTSTASGQASLSG